MLIPHIELKQIAFFSSHGGSSMRAIVEACGTSIDATAAIVISNNTDSSALAFAQERSIDNLKLNLSVCGTQEEVDRQILEALEERGVDLLICSGYMKKLSPEIVQKYAGRIFNIHPALLPKYGGQGMYGINVHRAVIEAGEPETGITIHAVNESYDDGPIIAQIKIPVLQDDTPESLAERVKSSEPQFLVRTLIAMQKDK